MNTVVPALSRDLTADVGRAVSGSNDSCNKIIAGYGLPAFAGTTNYPGTNSSASTSISRVRVTSGQSRLKSAISRSRCGPDIARSSAS